MLYLQLFRLVVKPLRTFVAEWRRPRTQTSTLRLPPEIIDIILEQLPPESVVSFVLTCRAFYAAHMSQSLRLAPPARTTLLLWLEKDVAGLYFCHLCDKLHPWRPQSYSYQIPTYNGACKHRYDTRNGWVSGLTFSYEYHVARLAMNRHLYGASNGPPLERLQLRHAFRGGLHDTKMEESWQARILEGELYLYATITLHQRRGNVGVIKMDTPHYMFEYLICPHLTAVGGQSRLRYFIPELNQSAVVPDCFGNVLGPVRSCPQCFTDYQMDITWQDVRRRGRSRWSIKIQKWHQLGSCRFPGEEKWRSLATPGFLGKPRSDTCPAGMVRHRWRKQDGHSWDLEGSFLHPNPNVSDVCLTQ